MLMTADDAAVVRLFGYATVTPLEESELRDVLLSDPADSLELPVRQAVDVRIETTQMSCGYGVPVYRFVEQGVRANRGRRYKAKV